MLEVKKIDKKLNEYKKIIEIYKKSFPKNEKLPIFLLNIMSKRECVDFLAFYDNDTVCGFTYLVNDKNMTFVLYLAVDDSIRSNGYGSKIIKWIINNKKDNIVLNIEEVDRQYNNYEQRLRRQKFYFKNGFIDTGYNIKVRDDIHDVLYKGNNFIKKEYENLIKSFSFGFKQLKLK